MICLTGKLTAAIACAFIGQTTAPLTSTAIVCPPSMQSVPVIVCETHDPGNPDRLTKEVIESLSKGHTDDH